MATLIVRRKAPEEREAKKDQERARAQARRFENEEAALVQRRIEERYREDRKRRITDGTPHGPACGCAWCTARQEWAMEKAHQIVPLPDPFHGLVYDGNIPMPPHVVEALDLEPFNAHAILEKGERPRENGFIVDWNLPHHGKGQPDCRSALERVSALMPNGNADWWTRLKTCAQRECQRCGPERDHDGAIVKPGAWEIQGARRAAELIEGHQMDWEQKWGANTRRRIIHLVWSPDPERWDNLEPHQKTLGRFNKMRREFCHDMRDIGVQAGFYVVHAKRVPGRFNTRAHAAEGLHFHAICVTEHGYSGKVNGRVAASIHRARGTIIKRIKAGCKNDHQGPCLKVCECPGVEGGDGQRSPFATLLYLLSHASWPTLAILRKPGERFQVGDHEVTFSRLYPAFVKTSTQAKAIAPFGEWTRAPSHVPKLGVEDEVSPATGASYHPDDLFVVVFDRAPPMGVEFGVLPRGCFDVDKDGRKIVVRTGGLWPGRPVVPPELGGVSQ